MGLHDDPNDPEVWPGLTWKRLRAKGFSIAPTVSGEGGAGYAHPGYLGGTFAEKASAIERSSELVVFFGSANDMTVPPEELKNAVHNTLTKARGTAQKAHFLVIGPAWPRAEVPKEVWEVRDIVRDEAAALGLTFVDPLEQRWLWDGPGLIGPDGIHPNRAGQLYLAEKVGPLIEPELPKPPP
jgi:lysophospholipase L1-like esterase